MQIQLILCFTSEIYNDVTRWWKECSNTGISEVKSSFIIMIFIKTKIQITHFSYNIYFQNKNSKDTVSCNSAKVCDLLPWRKIICKIHDSSCQVMNLEWLELVKLLIFRKIVNAMLVALTIPFCCLILSGNQNFFYWIFML